MQHIIKHFMLIMIYAVTAVGLGDGTAMAATCAPAGAQGAAPAAWQTYCWLDFSSYNDTAVRSASGQNFSFDLDDGSQLTFTLNATSTTASAADDRAAPSWSGAAVGNSSFLNIPGRPILYMANSGALVDFTFSNITIVPPPGVATVTSYAFVAADAESTDNSEFLEFGTNGSNWQILDAVPPISGSQFPVLTGTGAAISSAQIAMTQLVSGNSYNVDELARGTTELGRYTAALSCTNANASSSTILPSTLGGDFTPAIGDVISCIITNTRDPANAVLQISKQSAVIFDPVNGSANPKAIPGAIIRYTIEVTNHGDAPVDTSSIQITDILPANISYNGASPIMFTDGATSSGLDSFDPSTMADFSIQPTGVAPYGYAPNATGFDSNVTGIIVNPSGILAASNGTDDPSFTISFEARLD